MNSLRLFVSRSLDPYRNLAFEDYLLSEYGKVSSVSNSFHNRWLFLWRSRPCVVIGHNQNPFKECNLPLLQERDIWLVRRNSGGGAVYHDPGNTNYTVLMPRDHFHRDESAQLVADALTNRLDVPGVHVTKRHDIAIYRPPTQTEDAYKISGSAYKLVRMGAYHHGTLLINADLSRLKGCLNSGKDDTQMQAKGVASVRSPVANLADVSFTVSHQRACSAIAAEFASRYGQLDPIREFASYVQRNELDYIDEAVRRQVAGEDGGKMAPIETSVVTESDIDAIPHARQVYEKLTSDAWIYGQTPEFTNTFRNTFFYPPLGASDTTASLTSASEPPITLGIEAFIKAKHGKINEVKIGYTDGKDPSTILTLISNNLIGVEYSVDKVNQSISSSLSQLGLQGEPILREIQQWICDNL
ncbi:hypothetical protein GQ42DRAFT_165924 [Ramicandelaber brevisporus]|nr:hypothetical protein GQ42DRAFT_165924 [Ramicandelaber brevisporus]